MVSSNKATYKSYGSSDQSKIFQNKVEGFNKNSSMHSQIKLKYNITDSLLRLK